MCHAKLSLIDEALQDSIMGVVEIESPKYSFVAERDRAIYSHFESQIS